MSSSVNLFNTAKSGLFAARTQLATTGHNISNVNTEGYSRQRVEQTTMPPASVGKVSIGTGTRVQDVHRINDEYITRQIGNEMKLFGQYEETDLALAQAETIFNEIDNDGMNRLLAKFFNEWRKLGNEPESESLRAVVRESAQQLNGDFHRIARSIRDIQKNLDTRLDANVRQTNELVVRVAKLNEEIKRSELRGGEAPDLRDQRDLAVKKLSTLADINVSTNERGELTVAMQGVGPLVSGSLFNKLYTEQAPANPATGLPETGKRVLLENLAHPDVTDRLKVGRLGGLVYSRDQVLGEALKRTDELAYAIASKVNEIHRQGFSLDNSTGVDFFTQPKQIAGAASIIDVSQAVKTDANKIATALQPDSPGDNRIVQAISMLQSAQLMGGEVSTMDDYYNATVSDLATVSQKNKHVLEQETHVITQLDRIRESISGVSLDEETTNLIQFQHAFDAAAKVIKVADELLEEVLNLRR